MLTSSRDPLKVVHDFIVSPLDPLAVKHEDGETATNEGITSELAKQKFTIHKDFIYC
jgi:hypothetical protein